jgi:hypothetical protein
MLIGAIILAQVISGEFIGGDWRIWYRRKQNPRKFWMMIAIQTAMWLAIGIVWAVIILSERPLRI